MSLNRYSLADTTATTLKRLPRFDCQHIKESNWGKDSSAKVNWYKALPSIPVKKGA